MSSTVQPKLPLNPKLEDWWFFKWQFKNYLLIVDARDSKQLPYLMSCLGHDGYIIYDGLPDPKASYADTITHFDDYFKLWSSVLLRRKQFFEAQQESNENFMEYSCQLRGLINECDFQTEVSKTLLQDICLWCIFRHLGWEIAQWGCCFFNVWGGHCVVRCGSALAQSGGQWTSIMSERPTPLLLTKGLKHPTKPAIGVAILFISHLALPVQLIQPLAASAQKWVTTVRCATRTKLLHNNCQGTRHCFLLASS